MRLDSSGISWTDGTLNSLYSCAECSVGCGYATPWAGSQSETKRRRRFNGLLKNERFTDELLFDPEHLYAMLKERKSKMIFVNEFSDLLHDALPTKVILEHIRVFRTAYWHQFQVLTKRSHRLAALNNSVLAEFGSWPENLWLGVSVCSGAKIEMRRIEHLGATNAGLKWISFKPWVSDMNVPLRTISLNLRRLLRKNKIAWTVVGGESGPCADTNLMTLDDARCCTIAD